MTDPDLSPARVHRRARLTVLAALTVALSAIVALTLSARPTGGAAAGASPPPPAPRMIPIASRSPAPDFARPYLDGGGRSGPGRFAGKVVVLAFWSSWCAPCRSELRQLQLSWRSHPAEMVVLGVDVDDSLSPARSALRAAGADFPNVTDPDSLLAADYRIAGTPTLVIIDRSGRVAARALGPTTAATILAMVRRVSGPQPYPPR